MWRSKQNAVFNNEELENAILLSEKRLFFLDGPSGCGKTFFLKHLKAKDVMVSPFRVVYEELMERLDKKDLFERFCADLDRRFSCTILGLEDIDLSLTGRDCAQQEVARLLACLRKKRRIILTGIDLDTRCGILLDEIGGENYEYYRYDPRVFSET